MNVISSNKRCRLECATAAFCGCGKCGGGLITVLGLLLLALMMLARRIRDLRGQLELLYNPSRPVSRAWVKTKRNTLKANYPNQTKE